MNPAYRPGHDLPLDPSAATPNPRRGELDATEESPRSRAARRLQLGAEGALGPALDRMASLAARLVGAPAGQLSLLSDVQVIAGSAGLPTGTTGSASAVADSLCTVTAAAGRPLVVTDAVNDDRVAHLPPVTTGTVGAYLGAPLADERGQVVGALCVFAPQPRTWSDADVATLQQLAGAAMAEMELSALARERESNQIVLDLALAAGRIGVFDIDLVAGFRSWDDRLLEMFDYTRDDFETRTGQTEDRVHPDDQVRVAQALRSAVEAGGVYASEYRIVLTDGRTRWIATRGQALRDPSGRTVRLIGTCQDTSDLRAQQARTASLLESMATAFFSLDRSWRFTYVNAQAERVLGRTRRELVGSVVWDLFPLAVGSDFETNYRHTMDSGEPVAFDAYYPPPLDAWYEVRAEASPDGLAVYFLDITGRRRAEDARDAAVRQQAADAETMAGLVAAARDLGDANSEAEVLQVITDRGVSLLGAQAMGLALVERDRDRVRTSAMSFDADSLAAVQHLPLDLPLPLVRTAVTGQAHFFDDLPSTAAAFSAAAQIHSQTGTEASAAVPLRARGRVLGSFSITMDHVHHWRQPEKDLLEAFAALTAQALDRLAAHDAEHAATELARRAAAQQATLNAIAYTLQGVATETEVLEVLNDRGKSLLGAARVGLALLQDDRSELRVLINDYSSDDSSTQITHLPVTTALPIVRAAVDGTASFLTDRAAADALFPGVLEVYAAAHTEGSAEVPLRAEGTSFGTLSVTFEHPHPWQASERELLDAFAALASQALARIASREAEHAANREVARFSETLQRSLLTAPPEPDHLHIAVRYTPAGTQAQVGGDWYDAFLTRDGVTSLVIGDVTGHDSRAAAAMGQLRNLLRGIGHAMGDPPALILTALDRAAHDLDVDTMATAVLAQIEQNAADEAAGTRLLRWSNAGHLPPLLISAAGRTRYLDAENDLLLGLDPETPRHDHTHVLRPGDTVLLYTDGLVERRQAPLQAGLDWLAATAAAHADLPLEALLDALLDAVGADTDDDVALLAVRAHSEDAPRPPEAGPTLDPTRAPIVPSDRRGSHDDAERDA